MTLKQLRHDIKKGESETVEFKSWIKASGTKERINLAVDELVAFANTRGGTVYFGVEDDGKVTGCVNYNAQDMIEAIYDKTRPALFSEIEVIKHPDGDVLAIHVNHDGTTYATTSGKCLKRLGKNSKPFYPEEMSNRYTVAQAPDFSGKMIVESSLEDVSKLEVYGLKEKLKARDPASTLPDMDDLAFLNDLGLICDIEDDPKLTIAGLLFVGKEQSINRLLPQAEVIYLHYSIDNLEEYDSRLDLKLPILSVIDRLSSIIQDSNKIVNVQVGLFRLEIVDFPLNVFQEALLNAMTHRDYENLSAVYVRHYPNKIVIENPGGFPEGITEKNIITHPSTPRNKLIAETLQRLKYVQRTGQGVDIIYREMLSSGKPFPEYRSYSDAVSLTIYSAIDDMDFVRFIATEQNAMNKNFSLAELMILRYLTDNRRINISEVIDLTQVSKAQAQQSVNILINNRYLEASGRDYMLTAKVYEQVKSDVEYTRDKTVQYIRAKNMVLEYLSNNGSITNEITRELCGFSKQQARSLLDKMRKENLIELIGKGKASKYIRVPNRV